ncbi:S8 family peptidase [Candidatus Uabimicrobium amorphum]|uniref:Serine protease n=1 Tax=Uabimicrobium amorphum TaxID=2596890 RepID=A0A5S9IRU8_UABAM|nr:S8 family serine peptidase [Candidatus Uabimicrobium amorphum]BBM86567.1 serine protease [Candidatus Uabimicrobium amorphum]
MKTKIFLLVGILSILNIVFAQETINDKEIQVIKPFSLGDSLGTSTVEAGTLISINEARLKYNVRGEDLLVAVLDTGLRTTHVDFAGRVEEGKNFTSDNGGNPTDVSDGDGHGTHVAGIIAGNRRTVGIAPAAKVVPLKVLKNNGRGSFSSISRALDWVINRVNEGKQIRVVNISISDSDNYTNDSTFSNDMIRNRIKRLRDMKVAVVIAAGNEYVGNEGMGYPAIFKECISVGAVFDSDMTHIHDPNPHDSISGFVYSRGRAAFFPIAKGSITAFSQRLPSELSRTFQTDIFAPGAVITSSGHLNDRDQSASQGTSQAAPVISGVILLMQQHYKNKTGEYPSIDIIESALRNCKPIFDGDDENDNVRNTGKRYTLVDAKMALDNINQSISTIAAIRAIAKANPNLVIQQKDKDKYKPLSFASETDRVKQKLEEIKRSVGALYQNYKNLESLKDDINTIKAELKQINLKYNSLEKNLKTYSKISEMKSLLIKMNEDLSSLEKSIKDE